MTRKENKINIQLPYICPDHPCAKIKYSWDDTRVRWSDGRTGHATISNERYECLECGRELSGPRDKHE